MSISYIGSLLVEPKFSDKQSEHITGYVLSALLLLSALELGVAYYLM